MQLAHTSALAGCPPSGCSPRPAASWTSRCAPRRSGSSVGMTGPRERCPPAPAAALRAPTEEAECRDQASAAWGPRPAGSAGAPREDRRRPGRAAPTSVCRWCSALYSFFISDSRSSSRETGRHKPPASPGHSLLRAGLPGAEGCRQTLVRCPLWGHEQVGPEHPRSCSERASGGDLHGPQSAGGSQVQAERLGMLSCGECGQEVSVDRVARGQRLNSEVSSL